MTQWRGTRALTSTDWSGRKPLQSDKGYLITQSGILCDNDGNKIVFNTGIFVDKDTGWKSRYI